MLNLVITIATAAATLLLSSYLMGPKAAVIPALLGGLGVYVLLVRRVGRKMEEVRPELEKLIGKGKVDEAVKILESLRPLSRWQRLVGPAIDAQIGALLYAQKRDLEAAKPHLDRAYLGSWQAQAMLGAYHFKKKKYDDMEQVFARAVKKRANKKTSLLWAAYAFCLNGSGQKDKAIAVLEEGKKLLPADENLGRFLERLRENKKPKLNGYGVEWYALLLEDPPRVMMQSNQANHPAWRVKRH